MAQSQKSQRQERLTVLLTGSTGSLGTYLLYLLLDHARVSKVICLNRATNAQERQEQALSLRGLGSLSGRHVEFLHASLSEKYLGLEGSDYDRLLGGVDAVLHNAWPVDFNKSFVSFQPAIDGIRNLIQFSHSCASRCPIFFISSIGVAQNWTTRTGMKGAVPETLITNWQIAQDGYGQSKLVSERILAEASVMSGVPVAICRVCQIAGPILRGEQGWWNEREWLPTLVSSSQKLKMLPSSLGSLDELDWVPVDLLAQVVVEQFFTADDASRGSSGIIPPTVYHISNPHTTSWSTILPVVQGFLGGNVSLVSLEKWVDALASKAQSADASDIVGTKLIGFFSGIRSSKGADAAQLATVNSQKASPTLASMKAVQPEWVDLWMKQWKARNMI